MNSRSAAPRRKLCVLMMGITLGWPAQGALREENFDREPANWVGVNNRNTHFEPKEVVQNFGYSPGTSRAGGEAGEIGGRLNPAGETAYYGWRLPQALTLDSTMTAEGKIMVPPGPGHFMFGFFHTNSLNEWRTPNSLTVRVNGRGAESHYHLEYCTSKWRAGAGVVGEIVPGERISARNIENGKVYQWKLEYDPKGANGRGLMTFTLDGQKATCELEGDHRQDGITVTHFGLMPLLKTWDSPGEAWLDDIVVNGKRFDFSADPKWEERNNRRTYITTDTRPRFDFGWSSTHHARGKKAGELGGLIFRGDCREPARMGSYGDKIGTIKTSGVIEARGKVAMIRGITDATASIGFYHSEHSTKVNPSQKHSIPMSFLGINIEGPSSEGFYFYPVYRMQGDQSAVADVRKFSRIYPDGQSHDWFLKYDPEGAGGRGTITVGLGGHTATMELQPGHKEVGATFDRFGICTPWIDGNSVTVFFDDLVYTVEE